MMRRIVFGISLILIACVNGQAQTRTAELTKIDPRGEPELILCNQNLELFGSASALRGRSASITPEIVKARADALALRIARAKCDAIAVQEIVAKTELEADESLQLLARALRSATGRVFEWRFGQNNDESLRNAFLVAADRASIQNVVSYSKAELPKLTVDQKPRFFPRGPLEIQLYVRGRGESPTKTVSLVTFHFKSRAGRGDPTGLQWETARMEMAEALRTIIERRHGRAFDSSVTLLAVLGDRNSHYDTASARILEGTLTLDHFRYEGACRMSKSGQPLCHAEVPREQKLFSVLTSDPQTKLLPGTFTYKGEPLWLDDILMPSESLSAAWENYAEEGDYASGIVTEPKEASDHALIWVALNW